MVKARKKNSFRRKQAKRPPYKIVLIVCEGTKTEPHYFRELCEELRLNTANIEIIPSDKGNDPLSIVEHAINKYEKDREYDKIYCVFDKDTHTTYQKALEKIKHSKLSMHAINSVPCFEYWLLLHFNYTLKPFTTNQVIKVLKNHIQGYQKNTQGIYGKTEKYLDKAILHAKRGENEVEKIETDNPSTKVYKLVEDLKILKNASQQRPYSSPK